MAIHELQESPEGTVIGVIDPARAPLLTVESGDEIVASTAHMFGGQVTPSTTAEEMASFLAAWREKGALGPHTLSGPVNIEGAQPGDAVRVEMLELRTGPHGFNLILPGAISRGILADRFSEGSVSHYSLDRDRMCTEIAPGLEVPLRPFLGIVGVAPAGHELHSTVEPGPFGGNIDLPDLVEGTSIWLPVMREGAGLFFGDAHAMQGNGEVDQTGLETTMERTHLRVTTEPGMTIRSPRVKTSDHLIVLGFGPDLDAAVRMAVEESVDLIASERGIDAATAYRICSLAVDLEVTQVVNRVKGAHAKIPLELLA